MDSFRTSSDRAPGFQVELATGETVSCDRLLFATGGNKSNAGFEIARQFGMRVADDFNADAGFAAMVNEWRILYANSVVPQKPKNPRVYRNGKWEVVNIPSTL